MLSSYIDWPLLTYAQTTVAHSLEDKRKVLIYLWLSRIQQPELITSSLVGWDLVFFCLFFFKSIISVIVVNLRFSLFKQHVHLILHKASLIAPCRPGKDFLK